MIISSDTHVIEPPDTFERVDAEFRDRAPRLVEHDDGNHFWYLSEHRLPSVSSGSQVGQRFEDPTALKFAARFDEVRPGGYLPDRHLEDNAADGVWGSVLYATLGLQVLWIEDEALLAAILRGYNDWLAEFCAYAPHRLKGVALFSLDDVDASVAELHRVREAGLAGVGIPVGAPRGRRYGDPDLDRFWAAATDLGLPVSMHIGGHRRWGEGVRGNFVPSALATPDHWQRVAIADMIFGGVFERHPGLVVGSVECELGWVPYFLDRMDFLYTQSPRGDARDWVQLSDGMLPSDVFRRNVYVSFQQDAIGIEHRDLIGMDGLMFGSDYPHPESTFPKSGEISDGLLADLDAPDRRRLLCENVARVYDFDLAALEAEAAVAARSN